MSQVTRTITDEERRARLARRHLLLPATRTDDIATIADSVVALHSTDPVTVYLSAMVRMTHPSVGAVETALYDDRSVVRHHAMRRTLWVATPGVVRLMHAAATRKLVGPEQRRIAGLLAASGVSDPDRWLEEAGEHVLAALADHGPMTARELGVKVPELTRKIVMAPDRDYTATVSAHTRVLLILGFQGRIVRTRPSGTWVNGAYTYAAMDAWLDGGLGDLTVREAARELALRWLWRFGPARTVDLQWWMGWTGGVTRAALADCDAVPVALADGDGWVAPGDEEPVDPVEPWVALLPGLDPSTMGWKERGWYLPANAAEAFDRMGNAGPTVWVDGQVVGVWDQCADGELRTRSFLTLGSDQQAAVERRLHDLAGMLGATRFTVRFPSPASRALRVTAGQAAASPARG